MSDLHVMAQELIEYLVNIENTVRCDEALHNPSWSWKNFWFNEISGYNKLDFIEHALGVTDTNEQVLIMEAVKSIVFDED